MNKLIICLIVFLFASCGRNRIKVISGLEGKPLPSFSFLLTDSLTYLSTKDIPEKKPFVIIYFSPICPYCRAQSQEIRDDIESLKDIKFYFVSSYPMTQIKNFDKNYGLSSYSNITFAQIKDTAFDKYYMIDGVPFIMIYNKEKKLKEVLLGKSDVDVIKEIASEQ